MNQKDTVKRSVSSSQKRCLLNRLQAVIMCVGLMFTPLFAHALTFSPAIDVELAETSPTDMVVADFNSDGNKDLAITMSGTAGGVGTVVFLYGDGVGSFPNNFQLNASDRDGIGYTPWGITTGFFNADAILDVAITDGDIGSRNVHVYLGDGTGIFNLNSTVLTSGNSPKSVATGDFNKDSITDMAVAITLEYRYFLVMVTEALVRPKMLLLRHFLLRQI